MTGCTMRCVTTGFLLSWLAAGVVCPSFQNRSAEAEEPPKGATAAGALPVPAGPPSAGAKTVAEANNRFAVQLYAKLAAKPGNVFFSPLSAHTALAMTAA